MDQPVVRDPTESGPASEVEAHLLERLAHRRGFVIAAVGRLLPPAGQRDVATPNVLWVDRTPYEEQLLLSLVLTEDRSDARTATRRRAVQPPRRTTARPDGLAERFVHRG